MWKKIKPWHIIVAILAITAIILIYVNRTWIATKLGIGQRRMANGNGNGTNGSNSRFGGVKTGTGTTTGDRTAYINQIRTLYKTASGTDLTSVELARLNTASLAELKVLLTQATSRAPKWYCCNIFTAKCCIDNPYPGGSGV